MQNVGSHSKSSTQETQLNESEKGSASLCGGAWTLHFTFICTASVRRLSLCTLDTGGKAEGSNFRQQWQKNSFDRRTRSSTASSKLDPWPKHWGGYWLGHRLMLAGFGFDNLPEIVSKAWLQLPEPTQSFSPAFGQIWDNARWIFFFFCSFESRKQTKAFKQL